MRKRWSAGGEERRKGQGAKHGGNHAMRANKKKNKTLYIYIYTYTLSFTHTHTL